MTLSVVGSLVHLLLLLETNPECLDSNYASGHADWSAIEEQLDRALGPHPR